MLNYLQYGHSEDSDWSSLFPLFQHGKLSIPLLPTVCLQGVWLIIHLIRRARSKSVDGVTMVGKHRSLAPVEDVVGRDVDHREALFAGEFG